MAFTSMSGEHDVNTYTLIIDLMAFNSMSGEREVKSLLSHKIHDGIYFNIKNLNSKAYSFIKDMMAFNSMSGELEV